MVRPIPRALASLATIESTRDKGQCRAALQYVAKVGAGLAVYNHRGLGGSGFGELSHDTQATTDESCKHESTEEIIATAEELRSFGRSSLDAAQSVLFSETVYKKVCLNASR